jgi:hypothetical protein
VRAATARLQLMSVSASFSVRYRHFRVVRDWSCSIQYDYKDAKICSSAVRTSVLAHKIEIFRNHLRFRGTNCSVIISSYGVFN